MRMLTTPALARALAELHEAETSLQMSGEAPRNGRSGAPPREPSDR